MFCYFVVSVYIYEHFCFNVITSADEDNKVETFGISNTALVWFAQFNMTSQSNVTHKFPSSDMPEIRFIRGKLLKAHKLEQKITRLDRVTKAIVGDINYKMLGLCPSDDPGLQERTDELDASIAEFRKSIQDKLAEIIGVEVDSLKDQACAPTDEIFRAASGMAQKYIKRQKAPKNRPRKPHPTGSQVKTQAVASTPATSAKAPIRACTVHTLESATAPKAKAIGKPVTTSGRTSAPRAKDASTAMRNSRPQQPLRHHVTRASSTKAKKTPSVIAPRQTNSQQRSQLSNQPPISSIFSSVKNAHNVKPKRPLFVI